MSNDTLPALGAFLAIWVAGLPLSALLGLRGPLAVAASWVCGAAMLTLLLLAASVCAIPYSRPVLAVCWLIAVVVPWRLYALRGPRATRPQENGRRMAPRSVSVVEVLAAGICVFQLSYVYLQAVRVPLGSFDSWALWEYKGRIFWADQGVLGSFLTDKAAIFAHPAYPPGVPLLIAWVYTWIGQADPAAMKPLFATFYAVLLIAFYAAVLPRLGRTGAAALTAALALVPRITDYAGTGLADVPLTAALVCCAAALVHWRIERRETMLFTAALLIGAALLMKRDAMFLSLSALCAVALIGRSWRPALRLALPAALIAGPWYIYVAIAGVPDRDFLPVSVHNIAAHAGRIPELARLFSLNLLAIDEWNVLWLLFGALLLAALPRRRVAAPVLLLAVIPPLVLYVLSLSLSAWPDYTLHARTSLDRLILEVAPFALWWIGEQIAVVTSPRPLGVPDPEHAPDVGR